MTTQGNLFMAMFIMGVYLLYFFYQKIPMSVITPVGEMGHFGDKTIKIYKLLRGSTS